MVYPLKGITQTKSTPSLPLSVGAVFLCEVSGEREWLLSFLFRRSIVTEEDIDV